jgi:hypothetical protein
MENYTIDSYIDRAMELGRFKSERALDRALNSHSSLISIWRAKRSVPSDFFMIRLAKLAGISPARAMADLHFWKAKTPEERQVWEQVRDQLAA